MLDGSGGGTSIRGGVLVDGGRLVTRYGSRISNNRARVGGGVNVRNGGRLSMFGGGAIRYNRANENGGGVHVESGSTFANSGGTVRNNHANLSGGGLWVSASGILDVTSGSIRNNTVGSGFGPNVHVRRNSWSSLRAGIRGLQHVTPRGARTATFGLMESFDIPASSAGEAITIGGNRDITLVSTDGTRQIISQTNHSSRRNQRHFIVNPGSTLTLSNNITLNGNVSNDRASIRGGVLVHGGTSLHYFC